MLLVLIGVRLTVVLSYQGRDMFNALQGAAEAMRGLRVNPAWAPGGAIRMGEAMAR